MSLAKLARRSPIAKRPPMMDMGNSTADRLVLALAAARARAKDQQTIDQIDQMIARVKRMAQRVRIKRFAERVASDSVREAFEAIGL